MCDVETPIWTTYLKKKLRLRWDHTNNFSLNLQALVGRIFLSQKNTTDVIYTLKGLSLEPTWTLPFLFWEIGLEEQSEETE